MGEGDLSLFKWRAPPFSRGDNYEIAKKNIDEIKKFFRWGGGAMHLATLHLHPEREKTGDYNVNGSNYFTKFPIKLFIVCKSYFQINWAITKFHSDHRELLYTVLNLSFLGPRATFFTKSSIPTF